MPDSRVAGQELWVAVPPGWIELAAFDDEERALAWFDGLLERTPDVFGPEDRAALRDTYTTVRGELDHGLLDAAGVLVTSLDEDRTTIWQYAVRLVDFPPSGAVNSVAVIERYLDAEVRRRSPEIKPDDLVERFQTQDGRDGVAVHTTAAAGPQGDRLVAAVPHADVEALGVVHAAVRLHRAPGQDFDRLVMVTGVAPTLEERLPMSLVAAQLTLSAEIREPRSGPPNGRVDVDAASPGATTRER